MIKPPGVLLVLGVALALALCLIPAIWGIVHSLRSRKRKTAVALGIAAVGVLVFDAWAIHAVAPKGARTIAHLEIPGGRAFTLRHYRSGWFEYPKARFYARDPKGVWTGFVLISEFVNPNASSLALSRSKQEVDVPGVGSYQIQDNDFVNVDGSRCATLRLPPGAKPEEDDIYASAPSLPR